MNLIPKIFSADATSNLPETSERKQITEDLRYTNRVLYPFLVIGIIVVFAHLGLKPETSTALLWVLASLIAGTAVGFLFGIPKILQNEKQTSDGTDAQSSDKQSSYRQQVNTNLTEISDWLTKIIVGLTLINLVNIPPYMSRLADVVAFGLNPYDAGKEKSFSLAIIICFPVLGFFFGYLYTRLFLAGAFSRADQDATGSKIRQVVDEEAQAASNTNLLESGRQPTERQLEAAGKVAQLASQADTSVVRQQMLDLAHEYERIRAVMPPGDERTRKMEIVVAKMRTLALACNSLLPEFANSQSPGERLAAVAMLQVKPEPAHLDWLASRLSKEKPFIGYHASVALLSAVRTLGVSKRDELQNAIEKARTELGDELKDTDRDKVLVEALDELLGKG
jgi:hypothetical protein